MRGCASGGGSTWALQGLRERGSGEGAAALAPRDRLASSDIARNIGGRLSLDPWTLAPAPLMLHPEGQIVARAEQRAPRTLPPERHALLPAVATGETPSELAGSLVMMAGGARLQIDRAREQLIAMLGGRRRGERCPTAREP